MSNLNLRKCIEAELDAHKRLGFYDPLRELILLKGESFISKRFKGKKGKPKHCFENALNYALLHRLHYCEGYAVNGELFKVGFGLPMEHAWACDDDNIVHDPTWHESGKNLYLGIKFDASEAGTRCMLKGTYGVFFEGDLSLKYDINFIEEVKKRLAA